MSQSSTFNSPESVMEIVTRLNDLIDQDDKFANRRLLPRRPLVLPVTIQLLDQQLQPCGEPFDGTSLDLSAGGLGFLCPRMVDAGFALIQFRSRLGPHMPLLIEIRYTTAIGPFCKVGGRFHVDWSSSE